MSASWEEFEKLYDAANQPDSQLVFLVDNMITQLFSLNMAYKKWIHPKQVGVHKANRDGLGVVEESVHGILVDIDADGFVWSAVDEALCFEDQLDHRHADFTCTLCNDEPSLATFVKADVGFAAAACTHTNQSLAAAIDSVATLHESISIDGRISAAKLGAKNVNMQKALTEGLHWTVIKRDVELRYPLLPDIVQRAKNKVGQTQRRPDMWQVILHLQRSANRMAKLSGGHVDWDVVRKHARQTNAADCNAAIPDFIEFLKLYGGEVLVDRLQVFAKKRIKNGLTVPSALFKSIADLKLKPAEMCPNFAHAIIKTCGSTPIKVTNGVCAFISPSDVSSLGKSSVPTMMQAEQLLAKIHDVKSAVGSAADFAGDTAESLLTRFVFDKPTGKKKYESMVDIVVEFVNNVKVNYPDIDKHVPKAWIRSHDVTSATPPSASKGVTNMVSFDDTGKAKDVAKMVLTQHGFVPGVIVCTMDDNISYSKIETISGDGRVSVVDLNPVGPGLIKNSHREITYDEFVNSYKVSNKEFEWSNYPDVDFYKNTDHVVLLAKCACHLALASVKAVITHVRIREKPRAVFAAKKLKANELKLPAYTQTIKAVASGDKEPGKLPEIKIINNTTDFTYFASPFVSKDAPVAAWFVSTTDDEAEANVEWKSVKVQISAAGETYNIQAPYLVNKHVIDNDAQLFVYQEAEEKDAKKRRLSLTMGNKKGK